MIFDRYVGIPYLDKGRSLCGVDCWGLKWLVHRDLRGIEIASYAEAYVTGSDRVAIARLIAGELEDWQQIPAGEERAFDGVLMREGKLPRHIGTVTARGQLLHVQPGETSRIERYGSGVLAARVVGFYRYLDRD